MKKYTISTYLRPAIPTDVFLNNGMGMILDNKQYFFKLKDGSFYGPKRLKALPTELKHTYRKDDTFFLSKLSEIKRSSFFQYVELNRMLSDDILYIVDPVRYLESLAIHLKVKQAGSEDYIKESRVIVNTVYFKIKENSMNGPFYITGKQNIETFSQSVLKGNMFVFDTPGNITIIEKKEVAMVG